MSLQNYKYTIGPGATVPIGQPGATFLRCLAATGPLDLVIDKGARFSGFSAGLSFKADPGASFDEIDVYNNTVAPISFEMAVGRGDLGDDRLTLQSGSVSLVSPGSLAGSTGTAPAVIPARAGRAEIIIRNAGSTDLQAGPAGQEVLKIAAGQSLSLATTAEISLTGASDFEALEIVNA